MQTITEEMKWLQSIVKLAKKEGVTKTARKFRVNRQYVYRWLKRYDGTVRSLANKSTKPKHHPKEHTEEEIKLIKNMYRCRISCVLGKAKRSRICQKYKWTL